MERESGYYWVKIKGEWIVAQWDKSMDWWVITGNEHLFYDSDFEEIDERRIVREENTGIELSEEEKQHWFKFNKKTFDMHEKRTFNNG